MTTLADFKTGLRLRLNDPTASRWSDEELAMYLTESNERYSKLFSRKREIEFSCDGISRSYAAPTDLIDQRVYKVTMTVRGREYDVPHYQFRYYNSGRYFEVVDDTIVFGTIFPSYAAMRVRYGAIHVLAATGSSTIPSEDEDLIYLWAEYLAWRKIGGADASLSRWRDGGTRNDGPIIPHYVYLEKSYNRLVDEKKAGGRAPVLIRSQRAPRFDPLR